MSTIDEDARVLAAAVERGELEATAIVRAHLDAIDGQAHLHAWLARTSDAALEHAAEIDRRRARGDALGVLCGVPMGLKDLFVTKGVATTAGSKMLADWRPPYDGEHATRLRGADAVLLGKLALDEFGMGSSSENVPSEAVRNPWALDRVAGGSSGGSAAAVAARMIPFALGTDTGGSIRQPAAMCGVVGLKPSWGRVTRSGMIAFASSLDHAGPITRSVRDAALVLGVIAGPSEGDATCVAEAPGDFLGACDRGAQGLRIGVHRESLDDDAIEPDVRRAFADALAVLVAAGATIVDIDMPHAALGVATYCVISTAEAASNLARFDGVRYGMRIAADSLAASIEATRTAGFGAEVRRRILLGTYVLRADERAAYYDRAARVRRCIAADYDAAFARCDLVASPTTQAPAGPRGVARDPLAVYQSDALTVGANLAGLPAISIPCGFAAGRLPIGLQLTGPYWREELVLAAAAAHEDATTWHRERPKETSQAPESS